jgi:poly(A) polymerase
VPHLSRFERLIVIEAHLGEEPDAMSRLAVLAIMTLEDTARLRQRLRLSNKQAKRLEQACGFRGFNCDMDDVSVMSTLYAMGRSGCRAAALMAWAVSGEDASDTRWHKLLGRIGEMSVPELPLQGADIVKMGVPPGPVVGEILRDIETHWIAGDFIATKSVLLEMAQGLIATHGGTMNRH